MATSLRAFRIGLFEEHLEEASFLHGQRSGLRANQAISWPRLAEFERRLELHLDALVIGSDLALEVCRERSIAGDAGEKFAALSVFCRQRRSDLISEFLRSLDSENADDVNAAAEALKFELPAEWTSFVEGALSRDHGQRLTTVLCVTSGYRRLPVGGQLSEILARGCARPLPVIAALGRIRDRAAEGVLLRALDNVEHRARAAALIALLCCGFQEPLQSFYVAAQRETWPRLALGLGGDRSALQVLLQTAESGQADASTLLALGLLGDPAALPQLIKYLGVRARADAAALAMNWLCGADLYEDVFVPEPVDEDALFPREAKAWRETGQAPRAANGEPFGTSEKKLSTDVDVWRAWLRDNQGRFTRGLRYRRGDAYSPVALVAHLRHPKTDNYLRKLMAQELVIRYGCDIPFEVDMPVVDQTRALARLSNWAAAASQTRASGGWYFGGQPQPG